MNGNQSNVVFDSVIQAGQAALYSALIMNGVGAVALLAFIGQIINNADTRILIEVISFSLLSFTSGAFVAAVAAGVIYLAQFSFYREKRFLGDVFNDIGIVFVLFSYFAFVTGVYFSCLALKSLQYQCLVG